MNQLDPLRAGDVTGSDVPAIVGESPWQKKRSVMFKKVFDIRTPDTEATLHGKKYEPVAIAQFCYNHGAKIEYPGYVKHAKYTWLGGTVDGIATMPDGSRSVIEVKCPISRSIHEGDIPMQYVGQIQSYMEILDMDHCFFIQYKPAGVRRKEQLIVTSVERDREYMETRLPALRRFWEEFIVTKAFATRLVVAIQRSWRYRLTNRKSEGSTAQIRYGCWMSRFRGYVCRQIACDAPRPPNTVVSTIYIEFLSSSFTRSCNVRKKQPPEAARPRHVGQCMVISNIELT